MRGSLLAITALAILLTGCAGPVDPPAPNEAVQPATLDNGDETVPAVDLVGVWKVTNAAGEGDDTYLRLAEEVMVWNDCGIASGSWAARNDAFIASFNAWSGDSCDFEDEFPAKWVTDATGYGYIDGDLSLLGAAGERLATLTKDGKPRTDDKNPKEKLRSRSLINLPILRGFTKKNEETYDDGEIYDPKNGKTYSCIITYRNARELGIRGYIGISMIGRTTTWKRAD